MPRVAVGLTAAALLVLAGMPASAQSASNADTAARSRPRIVIHPRRLEPGPNSKRYCRAWLAQQYRVSGTVIVPRMQCWWQ